MNKYIKFRIILRMVTVSVLAIIGAYYFAETGKSNLLLFALAASVVIALYYLFEYLRKRNTTR